MIIGQYISKVSKTVIIVYLILYTCIGSASTINDETSKIIFHIENNLVSTNFNDLTLDTVTKALAQKANVKFFIPQSISGTKVSAQFQKFPLIKSIRYLLKERNYIIYNEGYPYNNRIQIYLLSSMHSLNKPEETISISNRTSKYNALKYESNNISDKDVLKLDSNPSIDNIDYSEVMDISPDNRIESLRTLVDEHTTNALPIVIGTLMDENPNVRRVALQLVLDNPIGEIPFDTLNRLSLSDESQHVRTLAQELLMEHYEERYLAGEIPPE